MGALLFFVYMEAPKGKYQEDILDEKKANPHYRELGKKDPKNKIAFESMAKDEKKHMEMLKEMVANSKKK